MSTWNKRAVQGALIRLNQTGMIKRFRARRKDSEDTWLTCIEVIREPLPEDHDNLKFRRQVALEEVDDEPSDEDGDGDTMMRDLEVDMLNSNSEPTDGSTEDGGRVPPQWVPERLLSNTLYEVVAMGGPEGWDSGVLRDRIVGKFWRRPMESYLTRLTDDWEATQPAHLRHLALIRDTRNTQEKKFVHYVYRTYGNFQKAVDAGEVIWAGVSKPPPKQTSTAKGGRPKKTVSEEKLVDAWGFRTTDLKIFLNMDGSGSLAECRTAIIHGRKYGPRWDTTLAEDIGLQKTEIRRPERLGVKGSFSQTKLKVQSRLSFASLGSPGSEASPATPTRIVDAATDSEDVTPSIATKVMGLPKRKYESGLLTIEQRIALGLKPKGRLSKFVEDQIREHRKLTGDPASIPDSIELERPAGLGSPAQSKNGPLMTKEERIAAGLPPRGRLGQKIEDQIREQRGFPKIVTEKKPRKSRPANEPALLTREQRIELGIIPHGRLPQSLMEGLREEREFGILLKDSQVILSYLDAVKNKRAKPEITRAIDEARLQTLQRFDPGRGLDEVDMSGPAEDDEPVEVASSQHTPIVEKRKPTNDISSPPSPKRTRIELPLTATVSTAFPTPPLTARSDLNDPIEAQMGQVTSGAKTGDEPPATDTTRPPGIEQTTSENPLTFNLSEVEAKVRSIKDQYKSRSNPGIYLDPFAKRKIGQGRPRNAFIATFRLPGLATLDWFTQAAAEDLASTRQALQHQSGLVGDGSTKQGDQSILEVPEAADTLAPTNTAGHIALAGVATSDTPTPVQQSLGAHDAAQHFDQPGQDSPIHRTLPMSLPLSHTAVTVPVDERTQELPANDTPEYSRPATGWTAINEPLEADSANLGPLASKDSPDVAPASGDVPDGGIVDEPTDADANTSGIQGVCGPITEEDTNNRNARKLAAYMGTKTGGGSQKMFRHKIIMQIIDLCNGAYPMHGEIGRPFVTLWKQQYPNVAPPNSSTVLSNLRDMIADPSNGLKKFSFLMRLRQSNGLKKKDMVVYQHLTPTSPQVQKLAYKMANYSSTKAHQYYPEEVRHLVSDESFYVPLPVAPKDESITLERLNPSLQNKIKEANLERRRRYYHKQKEEETARDAQNAGVEAPIKRIAYTDGQPRARRARLASLNDKNKRYRRALLPRATSGPMDPELEASIVEELQHDEAESITATTQQKSHISPIVRLGHVASQSKHNLHLDTAQRGAGLLVSALTAPFIRFYTSNGTFSTEFRHIRMSEPLSTRPTPKTVPKATGAPRGTKRVRIVEPATQRPVKVARLDRSQSQPAIEPQHISPGEESDGSDSSSTISSDSDDNIPLMQLSTARAKAIAKAEARAKAIRSEPAKGQQRRSKDDSLPSLLERLTGLTGKPEDMVHHQPKFRPHPQKKYRGWRERKQAQLNRSQQERKYPESQDPVDKFKKLCCTLVIATSMAGGAGRVDWTIVEKVHSAKSFDLAKIRTLWAWMQANMAAEIASLTVNFQTRFLEAYENGTVAAIEDTSTYDWAKLVRWAMHTCVYPELSLPVYREALQQFVVDLSNFEALDRPKWLREKIADRVRTRLQLQFSYSMPLHLTQPKSLNDNELKARSWIRANTATPQAHYDSKVAHEKLQALGDPVLAEVVGEYVDRQMLRMRRHKRLLPGRNYTFTAKLAKKYGRMFELGDFMAAVKVKKDMDRAFTSRDVDKRFYSISRAEKDGAIMAIMSLLGDGKVKLTPQLPIVNNEFGAPLPRLSVWGFMEGDYVHRGINRQRLFWDIHVVPTETYELGNPLQPDPTSKTPARALSDWLPLPLPPLPGKQDAHALLPIWSSIDGQQVTWPWWYRILNLVLQPLLFQPGATVEDILANCDEYTTETFEVELVLQWLTSINAAKKITGGGYVTLPGVWAVFGDVLHGMNDDWLNAHVQRKYAKHEKQYWRDKYHLKFSSMRSRSTGALLDDDSEGHTDEEHETAASISTNIMRHPNEQYAILREQLDTATHGDTAATLTKVPEQTMQDAAKTQSGARAGLTAEADVNGNQDIAMQDAGGGKGTDPKE